MKFDEVTLPYVPDDLHNRYYTAILSKESF